MALAGLIIAGAALAATAPAASADSWDVKWYAIQTQYVKPESSPLPQVVTNWEAENEQSVLRDFGDYANQKWAFVQVSACSETMPRCRNSSSAPARNSASQTDWGLTPWFTVSVASSQHSPDVAIRNPTRSSRVASGDRVPPSQSARNLDASSLLLFHGRSAS